MEQTDWRKCVLCGDSKDVIKKIPDNSIDFILTDPPYNIGKHSTGNIPLPGRTPMNNDVADWDHVDFNPEEWADEFIRILKPTGNLFIFTSYNQLGRWHNCLDKKFDTSNFMIWHKTNPAPKIFKAGFLNSCEMIFTCWNKKHTWNFISQKEMHNFLESPICMRPERLSKPKHPAQKPVSILKKMIRIASNKDDIIFDPFMGVGSVGVASLEMERRFIGVEINPEYFSAAKERINNIMKKYNIQNSNIVSEPVAECHYNQPMIFNGIDGFIKNNQEKQSRKENAKYLKPILKWAGGKEKELKHIKPNMPQTFIDFYEPFVGGGSVFTSINAGRYFINDLSDELISIYLNIKTQNQLFFQYIKDIDNSWNNIGEFFDKNKKLTEIYHKYRHDEIDDFKLKSIIHEFCESEKENIQASIDISFSHIHTNVILKEVGKNLASKMQRMKKIEKQKNTLPDKDVQDNILTALKSALYMYYRFLYNDKSLKTGNSKMHSALFLFIRCFCYSGMFRYNAKGDFNVPYGGLAYNSNSLAKKINYYQSEELVSLMQDTTVQNLDFEDFLNTHNPGENDFIFLDPPYDSEFSTYAQNDFTHKDHERLADWLVNKCRAKWMLIIKNTDFIMNLYSNKGLNIRMFNKEYTVSFMNRNNKKVKHLLITNY